MPTASPPQVRLALSRRFKALDSVRAAPVGHGADVVVQMWSGAVVHVHLIADLWKTRHLKRLISEATRVGIGSLLLIDHAFVPDDGQRLVPDDLLAALHALSRDRIYTYRTDDDGAGDPRIQIGQVHFKPYSRDEVETWYGPDVEIEHLPVYKVWLKAPPSIKGEWMMANFGSDTFWRSADYRAGREAFRQQERSQYTYRATWSSASWGGMGQDTQFRTAEEEAEARARADAGAQAGGSANGSAHSARTSVPLSLEARLERAYVQLGLKQGASQDEVKAAFRRMAREYHPDVSKLSDAESRFKIINEAYSFIKSRNGW